MKSRWGWAIALCALLALSGCIDTTTNVTVKADGSGTIEKTIVLSKHLAELMKSMGNTGDAATIEQGLLNEKGLKASAARMGSGVTFVSDEKITTAKGNGYKALYSFTDISKVKIDRNPAADLTAPSGSGGRSSSTSTELVTFTFVKGSPSVLTIVEPKVDKTAKPASPQGNAAQNDQMMAKVKPLYQDLHIALAVNVQGKIAETNAAFVDGSTVTLIEMDFGKILADDATFKKLSASQGQSIGEMTDLVKNSPGVKLDTRDVVTVKFN
jgi:hypothetical protein